MTQKIRDNVISLLKKMDQTFRERAMTRCRSQKFNTRRHFAYHSSTTTGLLRKTSYWYKSLLRILDPAISVEISFA
jgi:hypothetical protein